MPKNHIQLLRGLGFRAEELRVILNRPSEVSYGFYKVCSIGSAPPPHN